MDIFLDWHGSTDRNSSIQDAVAGSALAQHLCNNFVGVRFDYHVQQMAFCLVLSAQSNIGIVFWSGEELLNSVNNRK